MLSAAGKHASAFAPSTREITTIPRRLAVDDCRDIEAIERIGTVPILLRTLCETTGGGFAAITCATANGSLVCAVEDRLDGGVTRGQRFDADSHGDHPYLSVPIVLGTGRRFGTLWALAMPGPVTVPLGVRSMLEGFAEIIAQALELDSSRETEHTALLDERAAGELRDQFIAILGHDLRNPLFAVAALSEMLTRRLTDPVLADMASRILTNSRRMSSLIEDVMDFARVRLGGGIHVLLTETADLGGALLSVVREFEDVQPGRVISADVVIGRGIVCDTGRLQQVVANLLSNALTHGIPATPVRFLARTDDTDLIFEVWNDGDAIPQDSIDKVFRPFWRRSISRNREGLGLGLHICSQIVRAHDGHITVDSRPDTGTTFTARLPLNLKPHGILD